jgi:predicted dienelactone hydrolase
MQRKKLLLLSCVVALILPFAVSTAQVGEQPRTGFRPDAPPYGIHGPYLVGTHDFVIDEGADRPLSGTVWYPTLNSDEVEETVAYDIGLGEVAPDLNVWYGRAIRDAAPDPSAGPYPLIIYSPPFGGSRFFGSFMHEHLVSVGFVVMAVDHTGNTIAENIMQHDVIEANWYSNMIYRPQDISRLIDYAETLTTAGEMQGMIDLDHVGVFGTSFGGYTSLMVGGAQLDLRHFASQCEGVTDAICDSVLNHEPEMAVLAGLDEAPEELWPSPRDPRVDAIAPIVPGPAGWTSGPEGVKNVEVPVLLLASGGDRTVNPDDYAMLYENLPPNKAMAWFENGDHLLIGGLCPEIWKVVTPDSCWDPVWDLSRAHDLYDHFLAAFFLYELKGDEEAHAALMPDAVSFPGITYNAQGF